MRLFVAIPLSEDIVAKLQSLRQPLPGVKWTRSEQFHLTLRFIGDVSGSVKKNVANKLQEISQGAFELNIDGFGFFPNIRNPRVFWAGLDPHTELMLLQEKVEHACREAGLEKETRPYVPHITLAKIKRRPDELDTFLHQNEGFGIDSIPVTRFNLYQSKLQKHKAVHTVIRSYHLD